MSSDTVQHAGCSGVAKRGIKWNRNDAADALHRARKLFVRETEQQMQGRKDTAPEFYILLRHRVDQSVHPAWHGNQISIEDITSVFWNAWTRDAELRKCFTIAARQLQTPLDESRYLLPLA